MSVEVHVLGSRLTLHATTRTPSSPVVTSALCACSGDISSANSDFLPPDIFNPGQNCEVNHN